MTIPKVSVCVTTYNRAPLLDRTLASIAAQTRLPDEVIVSDDCSSDDTPAVVARWEAKLPQLRYQRNENNLCMPGNLNAAVHLASGRYVANLHDADVFDAQLLEEWERALDRHSNAGFVFCGVAGYPHHTPWGGGVILHDVPPLMNGRDFFAKYLLHKASSIVWGTVMARRTAYDELLPFDSRYGFISDVDMWMRMCLRFDVAYVRRPLITLDNSPTQWRQFDWKRVETVRRMQLDNIVRFFAGDPTRLRMELSRHHRAMSLTYLRRLAGRLRHRDWRGAVEGLRLSLRVLAWHPSMGASQP